jgi:hypothetical protein
MLFRICVRSLTLITLAVISVVAPATAGPKIEITSASLILQPPNETTANCPVDGQFWSGSETTPKVKLRVRGKKTNHTDTQHDAEHTLHTSNGYGESFYKLIAGIAYDSARIYDVKAWLYNNDDQAVANTAWIPLGLQNGGNN